MKETGVLARPSQAGRGPSGARGCSLRLLPDREMHVRLSRGTAQQSPKHVGKRQVPGALSRLLQPRPGVSAPRLSQPPGCPPPGAGTRPPHGHGPRCGTPAPALQPPGGPAARTPSRAAALRGCPHE
uniref:Uncharacterized protein n=1 Tax=Rousettus aegyptiacus TaxID=9407 RepID=A0A7J8JFK2_ROUAE|nr:hypothetical protein HJG63_010065 [Rousettus aegyptiacus]